MPNDKIGFLIKQVHILQEQRLNKKFERFGLTGAQTFTLVSLFKARERIKSKRFRKNSRYF